MTFPGYYIWRVCNVSRGKEKAFALVMETKYARDPAIDRKSRKITDIMTVSREISRDIFEMRVDHYLRDIIPRAKFHRAAARFG